MGIVPSPVLDAVFGVTARAGFPLFPPRTIPALTSRQLPLAAAHPPRVCSLFSRHMLPSKAGEGSQASLVFYTTVSTLRFSVRFLATQTRAQQRLRRT